MHMTVGILNWVFSFLFIAQNSFCQTKLPPPCDREIFCHGQLLHTVQMAHLYNDSKHFVDMSLINSPEETLIAFNAMMNRTQHKPKKEQVQEFVDNNFNDMNSTTSLAFVPWIPDDWRDLRHNYTFFNNISDSSLREWGYKLNDMWKSLGKKVSEEVKNNEEKYSSIYVENGVVVPGGRFREFYYWDSYWTMEGLLLCNMTETVKGMLENFVHMVEKYGMVPNGGRVYYTRRSQPPYLIPMFKLYHDYTNDTQFIRDNLPLLEKEFNFWEKNRTTPIRDRKGNVRKIYQYKAMVDGARPESYREDYLLAEDGLTEQDKTNLYIELKSGAESGWDYSTRWFFNNEMIGTLDDINVTAIAPVDLNSLMCLNAKILSEFKLLDHRRGESEDYETMAKEKREIMTDIFWDRHDGIWYDVNIHTGNKRKKFYLSNVHPLWSGCYEEIDWEEKTIAEKVIDYLEKANVLKYKGGVPTTKVKSGQQWDDPNAWAPLQHLLIMGLYNQSHLPSAQKYAYSLADKWIRNNYNAFRDTGLMFEKYDAHRLGLPGGGGEYEVVVGFGWTNGVALKLLEIFGDRLSSVTPSNASIVQVPSLIYLITLFSTYLFYYH